MTTRRVVTTCTVAMLIAAGCGDDDDGVATPEPETAVVGPSRRHQVEKMSPHEIAAITQRLGGRVNAVSGTARLGDATVSVDDVFGPGAVVTTGDDGRVTVDLLREMRLEIGPSSHVVRGTLREGELFLSAGVVRAQLPPVGGGSRPALRVGTPSGTVVLAGAGSTLIAALPSGDTWVVQFAGAAAVGRGDVSGDTGERRDAGMRLLEGRAVVLGRGEIAEPTEAPGRVAAGWAAAAQLVEATPAAPAPLRMALVEETAARYDEAAAWLSAELERGERLAAEQREVVGSDPARARELTREIVAYSQRRVRLKTIALLRFEQMAAAGSFAGTDAASERLTRAAEIMGN